MRIEDRQLLQELKRRVPKLEAQVAELTAVVEGLATKRPRGRPRKVQPDA